MNTTTRRRILAWFDVDVKRGTIKWKVRRTGKWRGLGKEAGTIDPYGYRQLFIDKKWFKAHRIIWFVAHGRWPKELDHINGNRADNRLANLRKATRSENGANSKLRSNNRSGLKGAWWDSARCRWMSQIQKNGRVKMLGRFKTKEQAHAAYRYASMKLNGDFARFN